MEGDTVTHGKSFTLGSPMCIPSIGPRHSKGFSAEAGEDARLLGPLTTSAVRLRKPCRYEVTFES